MNPSRFVTLTDRFNFSDDSLVIVSYERSDHFEPGVTETTSVKTTRLIA